MGHVLGRGERRRFILVLLAVFGAGGAAVGHILWRFNPELLIAWYPVIPAAYLLLGLAFVRALDKILYRDQKKLMTFYMVLRSAKLLITIIIALLYITIVNENKRAFILILVLYYFAYLGLETWIFYCYERRRHRRRTTKKR